MLAGVFDAIAKGVVIAVRYGIARHQGGGIEHTTKIMDFPTHYTRLMPQIAFCYAQK